MRPPGVSMFSVWIALLHVLRAQVVGVQLVEIHKDVDLPVLPAADVDAADAVHGLERAADLLVGDLGELAHGPVAADGECDDGVAVRIGFRDGRRQHVRRQLAHRLLYFFANVFRRLADVALQDEGDDDVGGAFGDHGAHLLDAADGGDGFLERHDDLRGDFFRARARQSHAHVHGGRIGCAGTDPRQGPRS